VCCLILVFSRGNGFRVPTLGGRRFCDHSFFLEYDALEYCCLVYSRVVAVMRLDTGKGHKERHIYSQENGY
jgi:hypothetical protein